MGSILRDKRWIMMVYMVYIYIYYIYIYIYNGIIIRNWTHRIYKERDFLDGIWYCNPI